MKLMVDPGALSLHELYNGDISKDQPAMIDVRTPARVVVAGLDISVGSRPMANSVSELLVAFMLANSYEPSSLKSS